MSWKRSPRPWCPAPPERDCGSRSTSIPRFPIGSSPTRFGCARFSTTSPATPSSSPTRPPRAGLRWRFGPSACRPDDGAASVETASAPDAASDAARSEAPVDDGVLRDALDDPATIRRVLESFVGVAEGYVGDIVAALERHVAAELARAAHRLKGRPARSGRASWRIFASRSNARARPATGMASTPSLANSHPPARKSPPTPGRARAQLRQDQHGGGRGHGARGRDHG